MDSVGLMFSRMVKIKKKKKLRDNINNNRVIVNVKQIDLSYLTFISIPHEIVSLVFVFIYLFIYIFIEP